MKRAIAMGLVAAIAIADEEVTDAAASPVDGIRLSEKEQHVFDVTRDVVYFIQQTWEGLYFGLYGPTSTVEKIDDECFGPWIPDDMEFIYDYFKRLGSDFWSITYDETTQLAYDIVDMIFLNDQYCHFRTSLYDIINFCQLEEQPCKPSLILGNL